MAYNVYDNWERLVKKVLHEEKLRCDAFREFSRLSVSSSFSSSSSFRQGGYRKPGNIISEGHKNYDLVLNLQLGIRHSITRLLPLASREVRASDFNPKLKILLRFPPGGSKYTPPHQSVDFLWKDYCPMVFRNLREIFKLDLVDYLLSISGNGALREISSPGKNGSFFYLTPDDRFMIKRMKKSEIKVLLKILPYYFDHIRRFENTLLPKFYGAYCYKQVGGMKARFVVMDNLIYSKYQIHRRFDLKGSSYGRFCDGEIDETTTLKDLDLQYVFRLHPHLHKILMKQIALDCKFLEAQSIMDYSLVLGVHFCDDNNTNNIIMGNGDSYQNEKFPETEQQEYMNFGEPLICLGANMPARAELVSGRSDFDQDNSGSSQSGGISEVIISLGISGILQDYDINKKLERAYKSLQVDPTSISAVDPNLYSNRLQDFLGKVFLEDKKQIHFILSESSFLVNGSSLSFSVDKKSGKKKYMIGSKDLIIAWADNSGCWERKSHHNSRFSEVISLKNVCWLDIRGRIETRMLSERTNYSAYLVFNFEGNSYGFQRPANSLIRFIDSETDNEAENRASSTVVHFGATDHSSGHGDRSQIIGNFPKNRADGWMEVEMGSFYNENGDEGVVEARLIEIKRLNNKGGLVVEGIEFRPK